MAALLPLARFDVSANEEPTGIGAPLAIGTLIVLAAIVGGLASINPIFVATRLDAEVVRVEEFTEGIRDAGFEIARFDTQREVIPNAPSNESDLLEIQVLDWKGHPHAGAQIVSRQLDGIRFRRRSAVGMERLVGTERVSEVRSDPSGIATSPAPNDETLFKAQADGLVPRSLLFRATHSSITTARRSTPTTAESHAARIEEALVD